MPVFLYVSFFSWQEQQASHLKVNSIPSYLKFCAFRIIFEHKGFASTQRIEYFAIMKGLNF